VVVVVLLLFGIQHDITTTTTTTTRFIYIVHIHTHIYITCIYILYKIIHTHNTRHDSLSLSLQLVYYVIHAIGSFDSWMAGSWIEEIDSKKCSSSNTICTCSSLHTITNVLLLE
jgi:hypothetical protein